MSNNIKKINWKSSQSGYNPGKHFTIICEDNNEYVVDTNTNSCHLSKIFTKESAITDPFVKMDNHNIRLSFKKTQHANFSWLSINSKAAEAEAEAKAEATLAYEAKLAELTSLGFKFTKDSQPNNRKYFSTRELFEFEGEIYTEKDCKFFEICLAGSENPTKTQLLYTSFNLEEKLQEKSFMKIFNLIKNISKAKIAWVYAQKSDSQKIYDLDCSLKARGERLAKAGLAIENFLETGIINGDRLGSDSWHDCSHKAEEQAKELGQILKFKVVTEHGYKKELNVLCWHVYDDGVSNHPYSNSASLTISEEVRLNLTKNQLGWIFSEGWIK